MAIELLETKIETRHFVFPRETNQMHNAQGGNLLRWMEHASGMASMRCAGADVLLVGIDGMSMTEPIPRGDVVLIDAYVYETGTSSMRVYVRTYHEDPKTGEQTPAATATLVLVAIDENRETTEVPDITTATEDGRQLRAQARTD